MSRLLPAVFALFLVPAAASAGGMVFDLPILTFPGDSGTVSTSNCTPNGDTKAGDTRVCE